MTHRRLFVEGCAAGLLCVATAANAAPFAAGVTYPLATNDSDARGAYPARSLAIATRNGFAALRIFTSALLNKSFFSSFCLTLLCVLDAMPDAIFNNP